MTPTPTRSGQPIRLADFPTITQALDYAAGGATGLNVYDSKGALTESLTWREVRDEARAHAGRLLSAGLTPGERVALLAETDGDFVRAFFACQYAGLLPAPLPLPAAFGGKAPYLEQLSGMMERADASAVIGPAGMVPWLMEASADVGLRFVGTLADLPSADPTVDAATDADAVAYIQFSSGSTRAPQGVAVTQAALMANARAVARHGLRVREGDRATSWLPMYHDMGLVGFLLIPLACQLSIDLIPTRAFVRRPLLWLELISRNGGTLSYSPSFGYELCARRAEGGLSEGLDLKGWRVAGIGGDMVRPAVLEAFADRFAPAGFESASFTASYGMAEATLALSMAPLGQGLRTHAAQGGRAFVLNGPILEGHEVQVRDEEDAALPNGRVGRLHVRGPSLMQGYWGDAAGTAEALDAQGWLDTGDLGYLHDGQIVITGRAKDLIIVNGRNVWPQDLEWSVEAEVAGVRTGDAAAFSVDDGEVEQVVVLVQTRTRDEQSRAALREAVAAHVRVRHGLAARVELIGAHALPHTSSGKLSRTRARQLWLDGALAREPASAE